MAISDYNPFAKRSEFSSSNLAAYKLLTIVSWLLVVTAGVYFTFKAPEHCRHEDHCHTIWGQNNHRPTPFSLNAIVVSVYFVVMWLMQLNYVRYLWSADSHFVTSAGNVGSHFILNNLLIFGHILLWVYGHFWPAEILLVVNLFNMIALYFNHSTTPRFIHIAVVSAPLAWVYVAILWNGAAMVNARSLPARILANIAIWGILAVGGFYLLAFKDYTMGLELAVLTLALALAQIATHVIAFQWIFAFVIMGCLVLLSVLVGVPGVFGQDKAPAQGAVVSEDRERQPLLDDQ